MNHVSTKKKVSCISIYSSNIVLISIDLINFCVFVMPIFVATTILNGNVTSNFRKILN